jgi:hypothetical protein
MRARGVQQPGSRVWCIEVLRIIVGEKWPRKRRSRISPQNLRSVPATVPDAKSCKCSEV